MIMQRPTTGHFVARNTFLALLAMLGILSFDAAHVFHHLQDDQAPLSHDVDSHGWWDGILFHTGTIVEPVFLIPIPAHRVVARILFDLPDQTHATPLLVFDSRAPPAA